MIKRAIGFIASVFKVTAAIVAAGAAAVFLYFLVMVVTMFDRGPCDDTHKSVMQMRSILQDELAGLYDRVMGLREKHAYEQLMRSGDAPIPDDLAYLKAMRISFGGPSDDVVITLTKCNVSVGINLFFTNGDYGPERIEINWHQPTPENPYWQESEVLWPK